MQFCAKVTKKFVKLTDKVVFVNKWMGITPKNRDEKDEKNIFEIHN